MTNLTRGGGGILGFKHSNETKRLIGEKNKISLLGNEPWNKGERKLHTIICENCSTVVNTDVKGRRFCNRKCYDKFKSKNGNSAESNKRNSDSVYEVIKNRGKGFTAGIEQPKLQKPVICVNDHLNFKSILAAANHYGISRTTIGRQCNKKRGKTRSGLMFRFRTHSE